MALADPDLDLLTVAEAAEQLRVTPDAVSRFLKRGILPVHRVGPDEVRVRRADLRGLVETAGDEEENRGHRPASSEGERGPWPVYHDIAAALRPLTQEEIERGLAAMTAARKLREQMRAERDGELFPSSWPLIREARDER